MITEHGEGIYRSKCLSFLKSMIAIPSPSGCENALAVFIESTLSNMRLAPERIPTGDGRYAILCEVGALAHGDSLLLAGHIDTVPPVSGWNTEPYCAVFDNNNATEAMRIYGLGACDMKAGLAIMLTIAAIGSALRTEKVSTSLATPSSLMVVENLQKDVRLCQATICHVSNSKLSIKSALTEPNEEISNNTGTLYLLFVPDEEAISAGVHAAIAHGLPGNLCLMPEPHYDTIIVGAPGKLLLQVHARGKSAHGARPEEGINAVTEMSVLLATLDSLALPSFRGMLPQPFVPLLVKGGSEHYSLSVPDECVSLISKQLVPGESSEGIVTLLQDLFIKQRLVADFSIEVVPPYYPPYKVDITSGLFQRFCHIARSVLGRDVPTAFGRSVSDANCIVMDAGIPVLIFGPHGGNMHQANEWVDITSVWSCLEVYQKYVFGGLLARCVSDV